MKGRQTQNFLLRNHYNTVSMYSGFSGLGIAIRFPTNGRAKPHLRVLKDCAKKILARCFELHFIWPTILWFLFPKQGKYFATTYFFCEFAKLCNLNFLHIAMPHVNEYFSNDFPPTFIFQTNFWRLNK